MQDSCDLDPVAKEICASWSLFVPVAQKYMQSTSVSHVGLFAPDDSQTNDSMIHILNAVRYSLFFHP